jgi:hypothetical protein
MNCQSIFATICSSIAGRRSGRPTDGSSSDRPGSCRHPDPHLSNRFCTVPVPVPMGRHRTPQVDAVIRIRIFLTVSVLYWYRWVVIGPPRWVPSSGSASSYPDPYRYLEIKNCTSLFLANQFRYSSFFNDKLKCLLVGAGNVLSPVLRSRSIFVRLQLRLRIQLVENSGSGSSTDNFPRIIWKKSLIFMVSKNLHVF